MKRLIAIVVMIGAAGATWAEEVKLRCEIPSDGSVHMMRYDIAEQTVNGSRFNADCKNTSGGCWSGMISDTKMIEDSYEDGKRTIRITLDRMTGEYKQQEWYEDGSLRGTWIGTCRKFEQKF